jgi:hypothetical protein
VGGGGKVVIYGWKQEVEVRLQEVLLYSERVMLMEVVT